MIIGILVGALLVLLGIQRVSMAPSAGGIAAGILMVVAGLLVARPMRTTVEELLGRRISRREAIAVAITCFVLSAALNVFFP